MISLNVINRNCTYFYGDLLYAIEFNYEYNIIPEKYLIKYILVVR